MEKNLQLLLFKDRMFNYTTFYLLKGIAAPDFWPTVFSHQKYPPGLSIHTLKSLVFFFNFLELFEFEVWLPAAWCRGE